MSGKNEAVGGVYRKKIGREGNILEILRAFCLFVCLCRFHNLLS